MSRANLFRLLAPMSPAPGGLIWNDQNGPRPGKPYATVSVRTADPFPPIYQPVDDAGIIETTQINRLTVEWQFIGLNALDLAQTAGLHLRTYTMAGKAAALGLGVGNVTAITAVPAILDAIQIEERAIIELVIYDALTVPDEVGLIDAVDLDCDGHTHTITRNE